ncbi:uncharacterized protein CDAR_536381 [Caerostris darwini]|uniref:HTH psq-type domain-containing protein n=1 Tax=Caerostris darwini TaxID=1538125 RepID=A0AAV4WAU3_9ARAC|nr:uncharacterized protein CDAR_536381 [Caerostris darwini]
MPSQYIRKKLPSYPHESLKLAVEEVKNGNKIYSVAKKYNIPYETLRRWVIKSPLRKGSGKVPVFTNEEEKIIMKSLKFLSLCSYSINKKNIVFIVKNLVQFLPHSRAVSFKNGIPGICWIQDFKKRWSKEISIIKQNLLIKNGKKSSPYSIVNTFFDSYETVLKDNNLMNSPERIFNLDEAGLNIDELNQGVFLTKYSKKRLKSAPSWKVMASITFLYICKWRMSTTMFNLQGI